MKVHKFTFNPFQENTYLLVNKEQKCLIIDPGMQDDHECDELFQFIEKQQLEPIAILNTHCHIDHILGVNKTKLAYDIDLFCHELEKWNIDNFALQASMFGFKLNPSEAVIQPVYFNMNSLPEFLGEFELETLFVPGHSNGHLAFYNRNFGFVISGDVLFYESIGRTDLPDGNFKVLEKSIRAKLYTLPNETIVYAGHMQNTTIGHEKRHNPWIMPL
ncbi:MAG: MBL fold metallo-hydrolase [Bacteroidetes bacterium]|nr:MBL fold metallo-hydrolase [Bacteroidota bacterium]